MWTTGGDNYFERVVPVLWHGEHLRHNGWNNPITLCFLEGLELLTADYQHRLTDIGYTVIDCASMINKIVGRYPESLKLSTTSRYWFLRWNVLKEVARTRNTESVVHLDGDVVLMADPNKLYEDVSGKTFMLQGCPAWTTITDMSWFEVWEEELSRFFTDRSTYVTAALDEKNNPRRPDREYCNVCAYGPDRFEDQDMLEYLIAAGRLPQATSAEIFKSAYYWIQNPLLPGEWHAEQAIGETQQILECNGHAYVGNKQVAFYHFQTDFAKYCRTWRQFSNVGLNNVAARLRPAGPGRRTSGFLSAAGKFMDILNRRISRRAIYEAAFTTNPATGNRYITDIINSCWE